ncbi:MAG: 3-deoxy-D-manno-octulosonic acid kinase [Alphaproteobacteria bacterium]|jgi:3-deoxy-D-manno-octulosonic acid kinase
MTIQLTESENYTLLLTPNGEGLGLCGEHFNADFLQQKELVTRTAQGRGTVYFFSLGNKELVLRHYKRGGLVAKLSNDKFIFNTISNTRCYEELSVLQHLHSKNVNVPSPIAGKVTRKGIFYTADIITEVIPNTIELHEVLQSEPVSLSTWHEIGTQLKKMHNAQVFHGDINVKNVLLNRPTGPQAIHLLDFDKCEIRQGDDWKEANLARFKRSLLKQAGKFKHYYYHQNDWDQMLIAYEKC